MTQKVSGNFVIHKKPAYMKLFIPKIVISIIFCIDFDSPVPYNDFNEIEHFKNVMHAAPANLYDLSQSNF